MAGQVHRVGIKSLPITRASLNDYLVGNCLLDSGSEKSLVSASVLQVIAPSVELKQPCTLISASGQKLRALGTCCLSVQVESSGENDEISFEFTVVEGLGYDCIFGWDFLQLNRAVLDCSDVSEQFKLKLQKPVRVPPRSVSCLCVKTNCILSPDSSYVLTGQRSEDIEITDSLIKPYTARQMPITIRNRSDRFITLRRRDVVGYLQPLDGAGVVEPELPQPSDGAGVAGSAFHDETDHEVNAVSSSDNQFLGLASHEVLAEFNVGGEVTGPAREKLILCCNHSRSFFFRPDTPT